MEKGEGQVRVTVQEVDRLQAITRLSEAVVYLAKALSVTPEVTITGCRFEGVGDGTAVHIDTSPDIMETTIVNISGTTNFIICKPIRTRFITGSIKRNSGQE